MYKKIFLFGISIIIALIGVTVFSSSTHNEDFVTITPIRAKINIKSGTLMTEEVIYFGRDIKIPKNKINTYLTSLNYMEYLKGSYFNKHVKSDEMLTTKMLIEP